MIFVQRIRPSVLGLLLLGGAMSALETVSSLRWMPAFIMPAPSAILTAIVAETLAGQLLSALAATVCLVLAVAIAASVVGILIGYGLARNEPLGRAVGPWLGALFASPLPLAYPIFLVLFGRSVLTIAVMSFLCAIIPVIISTRDGFSGVSRVLINVARGYGARERTIFWKVMVPCAGPTIFLGIRLGLMFGFLTTIAFEFLTDLGGLGRLISDFMFRFKIPEAYGTIVVVIIVSSVFLQGSKRLEQWLR